MFGFGRKKKNEDAEVQETAVEQAQAEINDDPDMRADDTAAPTAVAEERTEFDRANGPYDTDEKSGTDSYLDLGSLLIKPHPEVALRLEVEDKTQNVIAVTLQKDKAVLQVQAFAAPKSRGIWDEIRSEIAESVRAQGGNIEEVDGSLGKELKSQIPVTTPDGRKGARVATFVGVDGPRWFLRGVFTGTAHTDASARAEMEKIFKTMVVHRGEDPMPPRDLLPLTMPAQAQPEAATPQNADLEMPERGPEIAEVR
ncbi:DUF3710 domain-containing protein [Rothia terrae]|uniref:DUF3710 domain-containing protein n=1 Tax=Rothia terrae TaxID=396015 RepID=UPI0028827E8F|nr:DUF3710 domain-containing protein [Rothia terrae]MDT0190216.1 DUF3710 domain-containing protein [Rothia terrae]